MSFLFFIEDWVYRNAYDYVMTLKDLYQDDAYTLGWMYLYFMVSRRKVERSELISAINRFLNEPAVRSSVWGAIGLLLMLHVAERKGWMGDVNARSLNEFIEQLKESGLFTLDLYGFYPPVEVVMASYIFSQTKSLAEEYIRRESGKFDCRDNLYRYFAYMLYGEGLERIFDDIRGRLEEYKKAVKEDIECAALCLAVCSRLMRDGKARSTGVNVLRELVKESYSTVRENMREHIVIPKLSHDLLRLSYIRQYYGYNIPKDLPSRINLLQEYGGVVEVPFDNVYIIAPHLVYKALVALEYAELKEVIVAPKYNEKYIKTIEKYSKEKVYLIPADELESMAKNISIIIAIGIVLALVSWFLFGIQFAVGIAAMLITPIIELLFIYKKISRRQIKIESEED